MTLVDHPTARLLASIALLGMSGTAAAQSVVTDAADYLRTDSITATWEGLRDAGGTTNSYVAIARSSDSDDVHSYWDLVGFTDAGDVVFPKAPVGCNLEVRVYANFSYDILFRSAPFDVECGVQDQVLTSDAPEYNSGEDMTFDWSNGTNWDRDWLAIVAEGASPLDYLAWRYLDPVAYDGSLSGSMDWTEMIRNSGVDFLPPGYYEALYLVNDGYGVAASAPFHVQVDPLSPVTLDADRLQYTPSQPVIGCYDFMDGDPTNWIGLAKRSLTPLELFSYVDKRGDPLWYYLTGVSGCQTFPECADTGSCAEGEGVKELGQYGLRVFENDTYIAAGPQALLTVDFRPGGGGGGGAVTTDKPVYFSGEPIAVNYSGMPGGTDYDFLALSDGAPADPSAIKAWEYLWGDTSGTEVFFEVLPEGSYTARGMADDAYTPAGSAVFDVVFDPDLQQRVYTDPTCLPIGATEMDVFFENVNYGADSWVGIWHALDPAEAFSIVWDFIPPLTSDGGGTFAFPPLEAGDYEARLVNDARRIGYVVPFSVKAICPTATVSTDSAFYQIGDTITVSWSGADAHPHYQVGYLDAGLDPAVGPYTVQDSTDSAASGSIPFVATAAGIFDATIAHQYSPAVPAISDDFIVCPVGQIPDCTLICRPIGTIPGPFECGGAADSGAPVLDSGGGPGADSGGLGGDSGGLGGDSGGLGGDSGGGGGDSGGGGGDSGA
jgi:hypothetical protein